MKFPPLLFSALLFSFAMSAPAATAGNPYSAVAERNIFGLVQIPTGPPLDATPATPPPKITPNGIMTIFGKVQALFKVAVAARPGQPGKDESYVLGEGERQDDIEVTKIDSDAGIITFNNHGIIQTLPLADAPNMSSPALGGGIPAPNVIPGVSTVPHFMLPPNRNATPSSSRGKGVVSSGDANTGDATTLASGVAISGGGNGTAAPATAPAEKLTPEAQVLLLEKSRIDTQDAVNQGTMPPLPPTVITPADATGVGGAPLVTTPPALPALPAK